MKRFALQIISLFTHIWHGVYPYSYSVRCRGIRNYLFTSWIKHSLGRVGISSIIEKPCQLMGGGLKNVFIGNGSIIQSHSVISCWKYHNGIEYQPLIQIGDSCCIGEYNHISAVNSIKIGDGVLIGRFVLISDNNHGSLTPSDVSMHPADRVLSSKGGIIIGKNVWIGDKVTILGGITIGDGVTIAANSVVTSSIPSNCVVAGIPARIIKQLTNEKES